MSLPQGLVKEARGDQLPAGVQQPWVLYAEDGLIESVALYKIEQETGQPVLVGEVGRPVSGLAYSPDGVLYSVVTDGSTNSPELVTIDPATGVSTTVGELGLFGLVPSRIGLTSNGTGKLWMTSTYLTSDTVRLHSIDTATGVATEAMVLFSQVDRIPIETVGGRLYGWAGGWGLFRMNPDALTMSPVGQIEKVSLFGMSADESGRLWAVRPTSGSPMLSLVDTQTGTLIDKTKVQLSPHFNFPSSLALRPTPSLKN